MLSGFQQTREIFRGRKRIVYRATSENDNNEVILKTLNTENPEASDISNLKREYDIINSLDHHNIVKALAFIDDRSRPALVLEDIGGEALKSSIDEGTLDLTMILKISLCISRALTVLHQNQIIHKDINPKNIIVNHQTKEVRLIDFSISSFLPQENQKASHPDALEGTLSYMSPEQTGRMNRPIDYRTDFYSLGVTIYEMLTSQLPFEVDDPMESVHCHIAKEPVPPVEVNEDIPTAISDVVMKMLAKTAEDRYNSALGIETDLQSCLDQWNSGRKISHLVPGQNDVQDRFQIPQKLYGRENEIKKLLDGFEKVSTGKKQLLLVYGYSGIGKSVLINEIQKPIVEKRGYFVSGKFDQLQRNVPYSAIVSVFRELVRLLLSESEERLLEWKEKLQSVLGVNGQIVIDVIPEVELIIGAQPAVADLDPAQSENRFKIVFQNFIGIFCRKEHPLVIFLDDLQWADSASLHLMELIMLDKDIRYLYLIGAYRDNEVSKSHPLISLTKKLKQEGTSVDSIALEPLDLKRTSQLISDTFQCPEKKSEDLADLVVNKTNGNPFFLRQFLKTLHQEDLIYFKVKDLAWHWDLTEIEATDITNNVVDLMIRKLKKLSTDEQQVLQLAACIGNRFDLNSLSIIYEQTVETTAKELWPAIQDRLVQPLTKFDWHGKGTGSNNKLSNPEKVVFKFLHDRVQQAAYALIPEDDKKTKHLQIGKLLLNKLEDQQREDRIFEIADHLNHGMDLITSKKERNELARLDLQAGIKAKESTGYTAAKDYLTTGLQCLPDKRWHENYDLTFGLNRHLAETEYLMGNFEESEKLADMILEHCEDPVQRAGVYNTLVVQHTLNGEYAKALKTGRKGLKALGIELPNSRFNEVLKSELEIMRKNLGNKSAQSLLDLPMSKDPEIKITLKLLASVTVLCYIGYPELCRVATLSMVKMSMKKGNTPDSVFGYAFMGLVFSSVVKDYKSAFEFGQLAIQLSEKFKSAAQKCKATHVFSAFINHWIQPLHLMLDINEEGFQAGLESGELQFAGYHRYNRSLNLFYMGRNLHSLLPELDELMTFSRRTRNQHATDPIVAVQLVSLNLNGQTRDLSVFENDSFSSAEFEKDLIEREGYPALTHYNIVKGLALYLYGDLDNALQCIEVAKSRLSYVSGHFSNAAHNFYHSLILLGLLKHTSKGSNNLKEIKSNQKEMKLWADHCPENFLHKYLLIEAELKGHEGAIWEASALYDRAIEQAAKNQFDHEEALANELAAKFYLTNSREKMAKVYLLEARNVYRKWGALAKVNHLEKTYPQHLVETSFDPMMTIAATMTHDLSGSSGTKSLDFRTVIKAAQSISGELELESLLGNLIEIVIENAGAQKGLLLLERNGQFFIEAEGSVHYGKGKVSGSISLEEAGKKGRLPLSIINYVRRTKESLLLEDAGDSRQFGGDTYVQANRPKSILTLPIIEKGQLIGILYLENNLISNAFKADRLEVMQILSSQSAISLQNSRLYEELKTALKEVEELKNQLEAENIYLQEEIKSTHNFEEIISLNKKYAKVLTSVEQVAPTNATVLILGESGTGKELLARAVHSRSNVSDKTLVKINCATLPEYLIESELFGHEKGAFTGALTTKAGRFELADGGTIFLDEIGELPLELQAKLLRVLQEGEFERLGNPKTYKVKVRVIAATNRNLEEAVKNKEFREDLFYRLNVFPIVSLPLRERKDDIPLLAQHFIEKYNRLFVRNIQSISESGMRKLMAYQWPGNVRELENIIERAAIISMGKTLDLGNLELRGISEDGNTGLVSFDQAQRNHIIEALKATNGKISGKEGAAQILQLNPKTLESKMRKLEISKEEYI